MSHLATLGATAFEQGNDIRCWVPDHQVSTVTTWFRTRQQRETSVWRELLEETTLETAVLTGGDLCGFTEQFKGFHTHHGFTTRPTAAEKQTTYLIDVFDVTLRQAAMDKLAHAARKPVAERWVYFVTARELVDGATQDGVKIGDICHSIL